MRGSHTVCGGRFLKVGGHTASVIVDAAGWKILLDLGSGIINPGEAWAKAGPRGRRPPIAALVSHPHHDHLMGFPFFRPAYREGWRIDLYGPRLRGREFGAILSRTMDAPYFPVAFGELQAEIRAASFDPALALLLEPGGKSRWAGADAPAPAGAAKVTAFHNPNHPKDGVMNYRVECGGRSLVYCTDTEATARGRHPHAEFARGADLLIHDAQYTPAEYADRREAKRGYGHSTWVAACEVGKRAGAKRLVLFHHDPNHGDREMARIAKQAARRFPGAVIAREGMVVEL